MTDTPVSENKYPLLFSPFVSGRLRLRNRILHASMTTRRVVDQRVTAGMIQYYANRARGGAALVVSEPLNMSRLQQAAQWIHLVLLEIISSRQ